MPAHLDIALQRNEDYAASWYFADSDGVAIDLSALGIALEVRDTLTQQLIESAEIEVTDADAGEVTIILRASEGSPLSLYGNPLHPARLNYDVRLTDVDGVHSIVTAGQVILSRGETRA